jgi:hypothetical protein
VTLAARRTDFESPAGELKKALAERMLNAEMHVYLDGDDEADPTTRAGVS